jgi:hypothetical protein
MPFSCSAKHAHLREAMEYVTAQRSVEENDGCRIARAFESGRWARRAEAARSVPQMLSGEAKTAWLEGWDYANRHSLPAVATARH